MPTHNMSKPDLEALAGFRYRLRRLLRFTKEVLCRSEVTPMQYRLLLQIKDTPGREWSTVLELAERLHIKHHSVVALISRCDAAGLVRCRASRSDERRVEGPAVVGGPECLEHLSHSHRDELRTLPGRFFVPGSGDDTSGGRLIVTRTS